MSKNATPILPSEATNLQLPSTTTFLSKSPLDQVEKHSRHQLNSLRAPQTRRSKQPAAQTWDQLESSLKSTKPTTVARPNIDADWHEMPKVQLTPELQRDIRLIENRQHLDPKRFYKSSGTGRKQGELPTRVQVGTVVVGAHEFYSGRLVKRDRRARIMDQVLGDEGVRKFTKNRFRKVQKERMENRRVVDPARQRKRKFA